MSTPSSPRLDLVILAVTDLPRAVAFWCAAFELRPRVLFLTVFHTSGVARPWRAS